MEQAAHVATVVVCLHFGISNGILTGVSKAESFITIEEQSRTNRKVFCLPFAWQSAEHFSVTKSQVSPPPTKCTYYTTAGDEAGRASGHVTGDCQ
jgi:hypothetical protein